MSKFFLLEEALNELKIAKNNIIKKLIVNSDENNEKDKYTSIAKIKLQERCCVDLASIKIYTAILGSKSTNRSSKKQKIYIYRHLQKQ